MTARQQAQRFRQRKLSVKQNLSIVREHEVDTNILDDEAQRNIPKVETGVEKSEEIVSSASQHVVAKSHGLNHVTRSADTRICARAYNE
jgi:enhancer of polycomb-like protein